MVRLYLLFVLLMVLIQARQEIIDLNGEEWTVSRGQGEQKYKAKVPGQIHTDLTQNKVIGDPYYGWQVDEIKWIPQSEWIYEREFEVKREFLKESRIVQLVMEGLDTVAIVELNGEPIHRTNNMFISHVLDVKQKLQRGTNNLKIIFQSKIKSANKTASQCESSSSGTCPVSCWPDEYDGFCDVNFLRTEQCSFAWDWGPAYAPVGIWKPIYIIGSQVPIISDALVRTTMLSSPQDWKLEVELFIDTGKNDNSELVSRQEPHFKQLELSFIIPELNIYLIMPIERELTYGAEHSEKFTFDPVRANAWWPNEYGQQKLYYFLAFIRQKRRTSFESEDDLLDLLSSSQRPYQRRIFHKRFGFREVELAQEPLPGGKSFYFKINKVPIFVKGSNWIPADAFESRVSRESLTPLFDALKESHQNMIRNWGGGIYQHDFFYDLADEYGIMIWQDFMFACNKYAVPSHFLHSVARQVQDTVKRLHSHPSIALWAGNNENEGYYKPTDPDVKYYSELYFGTVLSNITALDTTRPRIGSSPCNGNETEEEPIAANPYSEFYGDIHVYLYNQDCWDVNVYPRPRFMSEFGLQSWPDFVTISKYVPEEEWSFESPMMMNRQHHPGGQEQIETMIDMHYKLPEANSSEDFANILYLSQIYQAQCVKFEVQFFRRLRSDCPSEEQSGCTMGLMYWQTNDIWPGASWSGIDYDGRYKVLQYYAKKFYDKQTISGIKYKPKEGEQRLQVYGVNDEIDQVIHNAQLVIEAYSWAEGKTGQVVIKGVKLGAASSALFLDTPLSSILPQLGCASRQECILQIHLHKHHNLRREKISNFIPIESFKLAVGMKDPELKVESVKKLPHGAFIVTISALNSAAYVWIETREEGHWSDNGFMWFVQKAGVEEQRTLLFYPADPNQDLSEEKLQKSLQLRSLWDTADY